MFRSATLRLTVWYVAIIMLISLAFSAVLYQVLTRELVTGLRRQATYLQETQRSLLLPPINSNQLEDILENQAGQSERNIQLNLLYFNLIILGLGTVVSYSLAKRTLHPIQSILEAQTRFTADASHELRTPLTVMKTEMEVALRDKSFTAAKAKELLRSSLEEVTKLEGLSTGLLHLARYEHDGKLNYAPVELKDLLEGVRKKFAKMAEKDKKTITLETSEIKLEADPYTLEELFIILVDNALKYSPAEAVVTLTATERGNQVITEVSDQGQGIRAVDLPHVFERFYRADPSRSQDTPGHGLGLAIAQEIVKAHRGHISLDSISGKGTTVTVTLPLRQNRPLQFPNRLS